MSTWTDEGRMTFVLAHITAVGPITGYEIDRSEEFKVHTANVFFAVRWDFDKSTTAKRAQLLAALRDWHEPRAMIAAQEQKP